MDDDEPFSDDANVDSGGEEQMFSSAACKKRSDVAESLRANNNVKDSLKSGVVTLVANGLSDENEGEKCKGGNLPTKSQNSDATSTLPSLTCST